MDITFCAAMEHLHDMLHFIRQQALPVGFDADELSKVELALEEALVNIIKYGYHNQIGTICICCTPSQRPGLKVILRDHGIPYDPRQNTSYLEIPDPQSVIREHKIGGYGIYFIMKIMDEVEYQRVGQSNILTLIKYRAENKEN